MSIFDENIITAQSLIDAGFNMKRKTFTKRGTIKKSTKSMQYTIYIENIVEDNWSVNIYVNDYYVQFNKNVVVSDMLTVHTILHSIQNITYDELYKEFQMVTIC
jgi:uncharacterized membrane-anchored protein